MATIALSGNTLSCSLGMGSFTEIGTVFSNAKQSAGYLANALGTLKAKIDLASVGDRIDESQDQVQKAQKRETAKESALTIAYEKLDSLITDVGVIDTQVAEKIRQRKDDFYNKYYYLKPECEKSIIEKYGDWGQSVWDGLCDLGEAIADFAVDVVEWCQEHWEEILIGIAFIVVGALITVFTGGAGTAFWAAFGAALVDGMASAALSAVICGSINAGCTYYQYRKAGYSHETALNNSKKAFGDGLASGFMTGGIDFFASAGIMGALGKDFLVGHSLAGSFGRGAFMEAMTNVVAGPITAALTYWLENDTLEGAGNTMIQSTFSGVMSGILCGGLVGVGQYKFAEYKINKLENQISNRTDLKPTQQGKLYEKEMIKEYSKRFPDNKFDTQCHLNSDQLINSKGKPSYQMPDLLVENQGGGFINYDFKWGKAGRTHNQNVLTNKGNTHVMDTVITHSNAGFSTNIVPAGTPFVEVHQGMFNSIIGVPINNKLISIGRYMMGSVNSEDNR